MGERKEKRIGGWQGVNVDDINLMKESMELINPVHKVVFIISVIIISNLLGLS
jgi:hypothetical protein